MIHNEDSKIDAYLLASDPKRFLERYRQQPERRIKCHLENVGLTTEIESSTVRFFNALQHVLKDRFDNNLKNNRISVNRIVSEEINRLFNCDDFLFRNSIALLIYKYRDDIRDLIKRYASNRYLYLGQSFRKRVYYALHNELTDYQHDNSYNVSAGMLLKASITPQWLEKLSHEEDAELLKSCSNQLVEKYQPTINIKILKCIDGSTTMKEDIQSDVLLMLLEKVRKGSLERNYSGNGTVFSYLNTIIQRDIYTALKKQRKKIDTVPVEHHANFTTESNVRCFERDDELKYYLNLHAETLESAMHTVCRKDGQVRKFKFIMMMRYGLEDINTEKIISIFPNCSADMANEIVQFANSETNTSNKDYFFGFLSNILARLERKEGQKGDSFRKNYERKEDKIWNVFTERHQINFNRRGRQNINYFEELVNYYFNEHIKTCF